MLEPLFLFKKIIKKKVDNQIIKFNIGQQFYILQHLFIYFFKTGKEISETIANSAVQMHIKFPML